MTFKYDVGYFYRDGEHVRYDMKEFELPCDIEDIRSLSILEGAIKNLTGLDEIQIKDIFIPLEEQVA